MRSTGTADLPLHYGRVPAWLYERMSKLGREITFAIVEGYGSGEFIRRMSNPFWFQSLGAALGMDWHSSGLTSSVIGALKRAVNPYSYETGIYICGGKGRYSQQTPGELVSVAEKTGLEAGGLVRVSRLTARIDNNAVQDGFQLYIHAMIVDREGRWSVVQQGMNGGERLARRYHWLSDGLRSFTEEPHTAVCGENQGPILNLTDRMAAPVKEYIRGFIKENPRHLVQEIERLILPRHHAIEASDIDLKRLATVLSLAHERQPDDFEELLLLENVGPKTIRALTLVSELIYGTPSRFSDPARYSFAHGGKDGHPYPVRTKVYDETIRFVRGAVMHAKIGLSEKQRALRGLARLSRELEESMMPSEKKFKSFIAKEKREAAQYGGMTVSGKKRNLQLVLF